MHDLPTTGKSEFEKDASCPQQFLRVLLLILSRKPRESRSAGSSPQIGGRTLRVVRLRKGLSHKGSEHFATETSLVRTGMPDQALDAVWR